MIAGGSAGTAGAGFRAEDVVEQWPCHLHSSCEPNDHTYTWPCDYAPGTGRHAAAEQATPGGEAAAAALLVALSRWVNDGNAGCSPETLLWIRLSKPAEEAGEVISALNEATGANPRKAAVAGIDAVVQELLDTAVAALAAVEHVTGHASRSMQLLDDKIRRVHQRALGGQR